MKQGALIAFLLLVSGICAGTVRADLDGPLPPESDSARRVALEPLFEKDGARGEAILRARAGGQTEIEVGVKGLKPNAVYTIWAVQEHPFSVIIAIGSEDNAFQTDSLGEGRIVAIVSSLGLSKWQKLQIAQHADGNPKNLKGMRIALTGDLNR